MRKKIEVQDNKKEKPYFLDYGYSEKEWSERLEMDRLGNDMWKWAATEAASSESCLV